MKHGLERHASSALAPLRICWSLMLAASVAWAGLGLLASPAVSLSDTAIATPLSLALAALGVFCAAATLWLDRTVLTPGRIAARLPIPDQALARRHLLAGHLALWSLAVLPAILGFAQLLLDGPLAIHLALCAVSLLILVLLMPTRARVAARLAAALR